METRKVAADILIHSLASAVLFPRPYRGKGTPVCWDIEERRDVSIAGFRGKIAWIGPSAEICEHVTLLPGAELINAQGLTAIPGFVDAHTHLVFSGDRSNEFEMRVQGRPYLDILAAGGGILKTVESVRQRSEDELFQEALERAWKVMAWGVTTLEIKSGYGLDLDSECKTLRVVRRLKETLPISIVATFMGAHAVPKEAKSNPDAFVDRLCDEWIPVIAREELARFNDVFTENKAFSVEQSRRILLAGQKHGLQPKIHADEINVLGGVDLAVEIGAVSADHLLKTGLEGI
ncbi:MAG TPA: imidazolonepropionase, partial [Candidatus Ozemobacteraceae bacterium]|nr:imidazolonepropionase [Candidatus Ozemobacteraceae bacterium]